MSLKSKLGKIPSEPGVYLFKNSTGQTIYIGKAKNLKNRARSYFQKNPQHDIKTTRLVEEIRDIEFIVTKSEYEAFILESNLVHKHRPRYNIFLKDDKSFPFVFLTIKDEFPRIGFTRRAHKKGVLYFGPFIPASRARGIIDTVCKYFGIRRCRRPIDGQASVPCLDYHIHRCLGPCVESLCDKGTYKKAVDYALLLLRGKNHQLIQELKKQMLQASDEKNYEEAAILRDRIKALEALFETQQVQISSENDADIFGYFQEGNRLALQVFHMIASKVVDRREYFWEEVNQFSPEQFFREFIPQFYMNQPIISPRIYLPVQVKEKEILEEWLSSRKGGRVKILQPRRGAKAKLLSLVQRNAEVSFRTRFPTKPPESELLEKLKNTLGISAVPHKIEAFDISNTQGTEVVASMVVSEGGKLSPGQYRRFKINTTEGEPDDFAPLYEAVFRRYSRLLNEQKPLPQMVLVDGGAGQVSAALSALRDLGIEKRVFLCGLAKKHEEIYLPESNVPIRLPNNSPVRLFLQRLRDEAHRFAITYHKIRRRKKSFESSLDYIKGIGPKRKKLLLQRFGNWRKIHSATRKQLAEVLGPVLGKKVWIQIKERKGR